MRTAIGFGIALLFAAAASTQTRGGVVNPQPFVQGSFGNILFPGGTSALPGVQRTFGNIVYPGGGGPRLVVPLTPTDPTFRARAGTLYPGYSRGFANTPGSGRRSALIVPYALPIYTGGFYDNPYLPDPGALPPPQPNTTVIYPPVQPQMIVIPPPNEGLASSGPPESDTGAGEPAATEPEHYLIAFKDRTIYAAVAYWVDGDTLHYFTAGNTHNQVSLSLVDIDLTERLNKESGVDVHLR